ncbi:hypothetical protein BTA35_0204515 [Oceanospirillum linum]|uniref:Uncharacterized protein n=2 Tax=Oceanospirillum linum TaxID=966 RepID=A0A1T1HG92_OCELI|nr:hypothetical protein BTA35_0204515 [Oceanospirillum linum]
MFNHQFDIIGDPGMPLWLQLLIIFIVSISGIVFHIILIKKIRVWAINDQINALSGDNSAKKAHLHNLHQKLLADKVPHKHHQDRLEAAAQAFED